MLMINITELLAYTPIKITVKNISVIDSNKNVIMDNLPLDAPILIKPDQNIVVSFLIVRNYTGYNSIERVFETAATNTEPKSEIIMSYTRRPATPSSDVVIAEYDIPNYARPGCGYRIFSRNTIEYKYNILQKLFGTVVDGPKFKVCILKE